MHTVKVRLTIDLIPEFSVVIYREGESPESYMVDAEELLKEVTEPESEEMIVSVQEAAPEAETVIEETVVEETVVEEAVVEEELVEEEEPAEENEEAAE
jgi:hypothetical protein